MFISLRCSKLEAILARSSKNFSPLQVLSPATLLGRFVDLLNVLFINSLNPEFSIPNHI
jgi:hypothetical protein